MIGEVAARHGTDRITHPAACPVAADNVLGANCSLRAVGNFAQRDHDRVFALGFDLKVYEFQAVVGLESRRRIAHVIEQVLLHAGLVHDQVRELRQAVFGILDATGALDPRAIRLRRTPEDSLVHPISLADELPTQTEGIEHFNRAARHAVGLPYLERAVSTLDESRADAWESRQLCRQQGPSRTAANDEDVDGVGKLCREDVGVAGLVAI